jgi:enoyl-CoA hydratase/carnithine racemase
MKVLADYAYKYRNLKFSRQDGILTVAFHSDGGPLLWSAGSRDTVHTELPDALHDIGRDRENRVIILTGTGDSFCAGREARGYGEATVAGFYEIHTEGRETLLNLLDLPVPVIGAVNGPAHIHAELLILSDLVLAADHAEFADEHFLRGLVPGDGAHVIWPMMLGPNRGRAFLLSGERIFAAEAKALGLVHEVVPRDRLQARAMEWARRFSEKSDLALHYTRRALSAHLKERLLGELDNGLLMEGFAYVDGAGIAADRKKTTTGS